MKAITNTTIIQEDGMILDGIITIENDRIVEAGPAGCVSVPDDAEIIDAGGLYSAPGLVDIHCHGSEKYMFCYEPEKAAEHFLSHGETTVLPTFYHDLSFETILDGYKKVTDASKTGDGRIMSGLYMEGPYMNGEGSNMKYILWNGDIRREDYIPLLEKISDGVRIWAIDPARKGIEGFMKDVLAYSPDAIFAMGHSHAYASDCRKLKKYGIKVQTHHGDSGKATGSAAAQGLIGAGCDEFTLYDPDIYAEIICDEVGVHLSADMLRMVVRTKGVERIILITDSMPIKGENKNNEADGIAYGPDLNYDYEGHLAGSHLTLDNACRNMMKHTGYGLCHVIRFASANPARLLGLDREIGSIEAGKKANIILIDDMIHIKRVIFEGETVRQF